MFFKKLDILSPQITLYHNKLLYHTSPISIILSIISFIIIALLSFIYIIFFLFKIETPKMFSFTFFSYDVGFYPINSSSFFHFINIKNDIHNPKAQEFNFESFRVIGFETYLEDYINSKNLSYFNHWLYGKCNNESYTDDLNIINQEYFSKSACIKEYYDSKKGEYYEIDNPNFRWPIIAHGMVNEENKVYSIIIEKCEEYTLNKIFNEEGLKCKNYFDEKTFRSGTINFYFKDQYIYMLNYTNPIIKYFNRIEDKLNMQNYFINYLYFNPLLLNTNGGSIISNNISIEISYSLDRNDKYLYQNIDNNIYMGYYLLLNNKIKYNERKYSGITDVMSSIGGTSEVIITIFLFINKIFNKYTMLIDTEKLFYASGISIKDIMDSKKEIKLKDLKSQKDNTNKSSSFTKQIKKISSLEKNNYCHSFNKASRNNKVSSEIENINNFTFVNEKGYKYDDTNIFENKDTDNDTFNINKIYKREKIKFYKYLINKVTCGKVFKSLNLYEEFRKKIISVENLMKSYLNVNNLIKACKYKRNYLNYYINKKYKYELIILKYF